MSNSSAQGRVAKRRPYRLGKRASSQADTRQRIVEAAVDLHSTIGPARTTVSQIAERAGVQRHTYYAHFPDDRSLFLACSGHALKQDPLPDPEGWSAIPPGRDRLETGLAQIYAWYRRNSSQAGCVLRDAEHHPLTAEMVALRFQPTFERAAQTLSEGLCGPAVALLAVALDFHCWRQLSATMSDRAAAEVMTGAIVTCGSATR